MMKTPRYRQIQNMLKARIQQGVYKVGDYLPSENQLCLECNITRTTARKALDELQKEGFIGRFHGKGSVVSERRKSLGLLNVKGFSEAVGQNVSTIFLQKPDERNWPDGIPFAGSDPDRKPQCIHFERLRSVGNEPVMVENNWFSGTVLPGFTGQKFEDGSFFRTLSKNYQVEVIGSEQELRALPADQKISWLLKVKQGSPVLRISIRFTTSNPQLTIYSELICNTIKYPIGNSYFL
jgi:DNA-binding GntR family transcriptional regulator